MIFLLIIIIICIILYYNKKNTNSTICSNNNYEHYTNDNKNINNVNEINISNIDKKKKIELKDDNSYENKMNEIKILKNYKNIKKLPSKIKNSNKFLKNYELIKNHYHTDYRDIISIINNTFTSNESKFNLGNLPVENIKINTNDRDDIDEIIYDFINHINKCIQNMLENRNDMSGWNEILNEKTIESGWDKQRKLLGLSPNLYDEPATNSFVELIDIVNIEKYITMGTITDEKISIIFILKKLNVKDMILIKIDFLRNSKNLDNLIIDNIYIIGYIMKKTEIYTDGYSHNNNFYYFDELNKGEFIDLGVISNVLLKKYEEQKNVNENWIDKLDENDKYYYTHH